MEAKKISFGFSKINKKTNLLLSKENAKTEPKVELIKCLEGQEIKLVEEKPEEQPLIIPLKESQKTSAALASLMKRRAVLLDEDEPQDSNATNESNTITTNEVNDDIEKRAARELLAEIQKNSSSDPSNNLVLPVVKPEDLPLDGAKESTLDDYDSIPIQDFGKAMLRGMGWTEPPQKTNKNGVINDKLVARPKGMGLGADKALKKKPLLVAPEANEVLEVKRHAYVRILGGKHKDLYGQIEGFDDHAGRIIVKMAIGGAKDAFSEFLCQPVSKKEYSEYGKCINTSKYEEYKKKQNEYGQIILSKDEKDFIAKSSRKEMNMKKECKKANEDFKYQKNNGNYEGKQKNEDYREDKKNFERKNDKDKESERRRENDKYGSRNEDRDYKKETNRNEERDRKRENNKDDFRYHRREYNRDEDRNHRRDDDRVRQRDHDRYETKSYRNYEDDDKYHYKDFRNYNAVSRKNYDSNSKSHNKIYEISTRDRDKETEIDKDHHKVIELNDCSDYDSDDDHSSKKSKKKSKKSKKSKSKYKNDSSSDTEISLSSRDSSLDSDDARQTKYKKKTKKSKKQRERSRSRGRR